MAALLLTWPPALWSQTHELSGSAILHKIKGLKTAGHVMYLAAHPDDENTKVIAYFAQGMQVETSYLALTRGEGGQNLIGTEQADLLGVLRTQELLQARAIDGGKQYFTRAVDFGYSKTPAETFGMWEQNEILKDVVWVIRQTQPDLIITRFPPDEHAGHGHHTASALLAKEALQAAGSTAFTFGDARDGKYKPHSPKRVVWNTSIWWYERMGIEIDESKLYKMDVGTYNPLLGLSYNSLASKARSQHRSQGFGDLIDRGEYLEYFEHLAGDSAKSNILEGIDFTWYRFGNYNLASKANKLIDAIVSAYNPGNPAQSIPMLAQLKNLVADISDPKWQALMGQRIDEIISQCAGLWCEVLVDQYYASPGDSLIFTLQAVKRSGTVVKTKFVDFGEFTYHIEEPTELPLNVLTQVLSRKVRIDTKDYGYSQPYWLVNPPHGGLHQVENAEWIGLAEHRPFHMAKVLFEVNGTSVEVQVPITYKWEDRALGEQRRPLEIRPKVCINFQEEVLVATAGKDIELVVKVLVNSDYLLANLRLEAPTGWAISPANVEIEADYRGEIILVPLRLSPGANAQNGTLKAFVDEEGQVYNQSMMRVEQPHIPPQVLFPEASCHLVYVGISPKAQAIGYIMGAGDEMPNALRQLGYEVSLLDPDKIDLGILTAYQTIVLGVRAYNTLENMNYLHRVLMEYVEGGGKVICQYNTSSGLKAEFVGPYELGLSRNRITDENARMDILAPSHPLFNMPNKITKADFDGWVQERGLYFPDKYPDAYTPLLQSQDPGEEAQTGLLLVTDYGKGKYIYTGLSFFRQLPAGVPGAYRLLVNLIEY